MNGGNLFLVGKWRSARGRTASWLLHSSVRTTWKSEWGAT